MPAARSERRRAIRPTVTGWLAARYLDCETVTVLMNERRCDEQQCLPTKLNTASSINDPFLGPGVAVAGANMVP